MKFKYHKMWIGGENGILEEFNFYVEYPDELNPGDKEEIDVWCHENCEKKYNIRTYGCWFQTREDATGFKLWWT